MSDDLVRLIDSAVLVVLVALGAVLWWRGKLAPPVGLAVLARFIGGSAVVLGGAHLLDIGGGMLRGTRAYNLRGVEILWIGGILVFSGLLNLGVSGALRRAQSWAWDVSGAATLFLWLFTGSLLPVTTGGQGDSSMNRFLFTIHSFYLLYWMTHRLRPAPLNH